MRRTRLATKQYVFDEIFQMPPHLRQTAHASGNQFNNLISDLFANLQSQRKLLTNTQITLRLYICHMQCYQTAHSLSLQQCLLHLPPLYSDTVQLGVISCPNYNKITAMVELSPYRLI